MLHHIIVDDLRLAGLVINPFGNQVILPRASLAVIESSATGMTHERVDNRERLVLGKAPSAPAMRAAFVDALRNSGMEVSEAYILTARLPEENTPHLLFLIDFNGSRKLLFPLVAKAVHPYMKKGAKFELLKTSPNLLDKARRMSKPVYIRWIRE